MGNLPIIAGCSEIIIGSDSKDYPNGTEVVVIARDYDTEKEWECPRCLSATRYWSISSDDSACECTLLRLDGGDFSKERESEKVREKA